MCNEGVIEACKKIYTSKDKPEETKDEGPVRLTLDIGKHPDDPENRPEHGSSLDGKRDADDLESTSKLKVVNKMKKDDEAADNNIEDKKDEDNTTPIIIPTGQYKKTIENDSEGWHEPMKDMIDQFAE